MSDFDRGAFEQLMGQAVQAHGEGRYGTALELGLQAYEMAPEASSEKGRAARDISARYGRLDQWDEAETWGRQAYTIHDELVQSTVQPSREAYREHAASAMYVGVHGLHAAIEAIRHGRQPDGAEALAMMRQTWSDIKLAKAQAAGINHYVDQYEINAARHVSIAESLLGHRLLGLAVGIRAVALAAWSESPRLDTTNPLLTPTQRRHAKRRALQAGITAVAAGLLSLPSRRLAANVAIKAL